MKNLKIFSAILALALILPGLSKAQNDSTTIQVGKRQVTITENTADGRKVTITKFDDGDEGPRPEEGDEEDNGRDNVEVTALRIDLGFNMLMHDGSFNLPSEMSLLDTKPLNSSNVGLHVVPTRFNLIKHKVNLVTAITFDFNDYAFSNPVTLVPDMDTLTIFADTMGTNYAKSKLKTAHVQIPLMLNFQTSPDNKRKNFHLSVGGYGGLLLGAKTKQKSEEFGKVKISDDFNLNKIRYGLTGRIGYRGLDLYVNYNLSSMFRDDQGPNIMPVTFGIALTGMM